MRELSKNIGQEGRPVFTGVEVTQYESGIPLKGWESVKNALNIFASGASRASRATEQDQMKAMGESFGGFGAAFYAIATAYISGGGSSFVDRMLQEAEPSVQSMGRWSRSYDYDGQGSFFKTTVEINRADKKDGYILQLNAAYVSNQVEEGLAEALRVERGLSWKNVAVKFEPAGSQFKIDFDQIAKRLRGVAATLDTRATSIAGKDIVAALMKINQYGESEGSFVLGVKDGVEVTVSLGRVGKRFEYSQGKKSEDRWHVQGATISGPLDTDYRDETKFVAPSISIFMRPRSEEKYNRLPAVDPKMKATMHGLASGIAAAFR
jgi:hypothetical protein